MMLEPSIDALQEKINSKYTLVTLSSQRARQMQVTKTTKIANPKSHKCVGIALEEIQADLLEFTEE